jgi:serine/threonine-protein kinase
MGSVWTAEHLALHSAVAVKLLDSEIAKNPEAVERFQREAQAAATLRSAHVVQVLDYGVEEELPFLVMELLQGEDLGERLTRVGSLTPSQLLEVMQQVARAVSRAHTAGIVHRDLKPENIFLVNEGDHELVKVLDFGIAKSVRPGFAPSTTRTGVTMGTPYYMSPEQAEGKREVDQRTDLWALGVIASECLTGVRPFDGETFGELLLNICARPAPVPSTLAAVPRHFDAWFAKATHRDPSSRFTDVAELVSTLAEVVAGRAPPGIDTLPMRTAPMPDPPGLPPAGATRLAPTHSNAAVTVPPDDPPQIPVKSGWLLPISAVAALALLAGGGYLLFGDSESSIVEPLAVSASLPEGSASHASHDPHAGDAGPTTSSKPAAEQPDTAETNLAKQGTKKRQVRTPKRASIQATPAKEQAPDQTEPKTANTIKTAGASKVSASKATAPTLRCLSDPFTGALRPAKAGQSKTIGCKLNPFNGQYQRL